MLSFSILDHRNPKDVETYEKGMFKAYFGTSETIHLTRVVDKEQKRLRLKIPYEDQTILTAKVDDTIIAAVGFNNNQQATLNLENLGFTIDKTKKNFAEGTGMFCNVQFHEGKLVLLELLSKVWEMIREEGYEVFYGFCGEDKLRFFERVDFKVIDTKEICGEKMFLLKAQL